VKSPARAHRVASMHSTESNYGCGCIADPVRWNTPWGLLDKDARLEEDGAVLITDVRIDRVFLFAGCFTESRDERRRHAAVADRCAPCLSRGRRPARHPTDAGLTAELSVISD
jgi:hypothetical protein